MFGVDADGGAVSAGTAADSGRAGSWAPLVGAVAGAGAVVGLDVLGIAAIGAAPPWFSSTSCRLPPMARAIAFSSRAARLCTMPIQFPETCTTARWLSIRTSRACCDSSMRVDGSSRLARICCQSSPRSSFWAGVVAASFASGSAAAVAFDPDAWAVDVSGRLTAAASEEAVAAGATDGVGAGAGAGTDAAETGAGALARADVGAAAVAVVDSASRPSNSTSSQRRG